MIFFILVVQLLCIFIGTLLLIFAREIGETMYIDIGITSTIEKYILRRTEKHPEEVPGLFLHIWIIRVSGILFLLFSFFMIFRAITNS